jgi:aminopeptidase N
MKKKLAVSIFLFLSNILLAQFGSQDSGGPIIKEQACYDVKFYDIAILIDTEDKVISGVVELTASALNNFNRLAIDLDESFYVESIALTGQSKSELNFERIGGRIFIDLPTEIIRGTELKIIIAYAGQPRIANNPPWDDGLIWKTNKDGITWASVACQGGGADIWWPCKDHPSDEPDSVSLHFTVSKNLKCISNGKLTEAKNNNDGTVTWNWFVSTPINNYNVTFYLGPYEKIEHDYTSITGEKIPFEVWILPENSEKAKEHSKQFVDHMKIMEELIGPYPFRKDKYAVVEAPHLGMEHQSAIAYGFGWRNHDKFPFDWLHHHEFSHEWFGNLVTCADWKDFWIHEGLGTYMQPLYLEKKFGKDLYIGYLNSIKNFSNKKPVAPFESQTAGESYNLDIYYKGAWIIHTLRYYLGDEIFFNVLRRWAYPDPAMEKITDGKQCRLSTTDEIIEIAESVSGKELKWFFEIYLRYPQLPQLIVKHDNNKLNFKWDTAKNLPFDMPIEIKISNRMIRVEMKNNRGEVFLPDEGNFIIDPDEWILMDSINFIE